MWSFHHGRSEWVLRPVLETYQFVNDQFAEIHAGGEKIISTQGHSFWVLRGEDLETRPRGEHITAAEEELLELRSKISGRWVDAGAYGENTQPGLIFTADEECRFLPAGHFAPSIGCCEAEG